MSTQTAKPEPEKLTPKQEAALLALLASPTAQEAAKSCGVSESTLCRWQQEPLFAERYAQARRAAMQQALSSLQQTTGKAVQTLVSVMEDKFATPAAKVSAARSVLEYAFKGVEQMEMEERIAALEASLNTEGAKA